MHLLGGMYRQRLSMCLALVCCCGAPRNQLSKTAPLRKACVSPAIHPPFQRVRQKAKKSKLVEKHSKSKVERPSEQTLCFRSIPFRPYIQAFLARRKTTSSVSEVLLVQVTALVSLPALALLVVLALLGLVPGVVADRALPFLVVAIPTGLLVRLLLLELIGCGTEGRREVWRKKWVSWCGRSLRCHSGSAVSQCRKNSRDIRLVRAWSSRLRLLLLLVTLLLVIVHGLRLRSRSSRLRLELSENGLQVDLRGGLLCRHRRHGSW